jgi:S1-C subfamily serine protease
MIYVRAMKPAAAFKWFGGATLACGMLFGCAVSRPIPVSPSLAEFTIERPRNEIFDAALGVAQSRNANVAVLEKGSGLVRFESATLTPADLDRYCQYPWLNARTLAPWDTFQGWNQRALAGGVGSVRGIVTFTLLLQETGSSSTKATLRGNWVARTNTESVPCNSLGVLEKELEGILRTQLAKSPAVLVGETSDRPGPIDATVVRIRSGDGVGSGFFVMKDLIATNAHVVRGSQQVWIAFSGGNEHLGSVVYTDNELDFALVHSSVGSTPMSLRKTPLVDGENVTAVGFPQGR